MGLFVSTTGTNVVISELGITIVHPTTDQDLGSQFSAEDIRKALDLTTAVNAGTLVWRKTAGGAVQPPADYDPDLLEADELNLGPGQQADRVVTFKDLPSLTSSPGYIVFSKSGGCSVGSYLYTGQTAGSKAGQELAGTKQITKITVTGESNLGSNTTIQIQRRTGLTTFVDIAGAAGVVPSGSFRSVTILASPVSVGPNWEVTAYNKSGSTITNPVVVLELVSV